MQFSSSKWKSSIPLTLHPQSRMTPSLVHITWVICVYWLTHLLPFLWRSCRSWCVCVYWGRGCFVFYPSWYIIMVSVDKSHSCVMSESLNCRWNSLRPFASSHVCNIKNDYACSGMYFISWCSASKEGAVWIRKRFISYYEVLCGLHFCYILMVTDQRQIQSLLSSFL